MRSRYTAYVLRNENYLLATWHPSTRPGRVEFEPDLRWLGLRIHQTAMTGESSAQVEFTARYRVGGGTAVRMRERSRFTFEQGRWWYLDGVHGDHG